MYLKEGDEESLRHTPYLSYWRMTVRLLPFLFPHLRIDRLTPELQQLTKLKVKKRKYGQLINSYQRAKDKRKFVTRELCRWL